jgi:hypothetical protein
MKPQLNTHIIFIIGFPRSGTTWFSNLINSHSKVIYRHELIGRNYSMFGEELFNYIKYNNGLTDEQYSKVIKVIYSADVNTDKPPFFQKDMGLSTIPKLHHAMWLCTKLAPFLQPIYNKLFRVPRDKYDFKILIKETRSTTDMQSILTGLRVESKLFLVRLPHGSIASNLSGITQGKMLRPTPESIRKWFSANSEHDYVKSLNYKDKDFETITTVEFLAINWRLYHLELMKMKLVFPEAIVCFYEDFVAEPFIQTKSLFKKINLQYSEAVEKFILDSSGNQKNKPLFKDSNTEFYSVYRGASFNVDSWREKLTAEEISVVDKHTIDVYLLLKSKNQ